MSLTLYSRPSERISRAAWALAELGVPHTNVLVARGQKLDPALMEAHPAGAFPALQDGAVMVFESLAIVVHLGEKHGIPSELWPAPGSPAAGEALAWSTWSVVTLEPPALDYATHAADSRVHFALPPAERVAGLAEWSRGAVSQRLGVLEKRLKHRDFLLGERFTLADVIAASTVDLCRFCGLDVAAHERVSAWFERCMARPGASGLRPNAPP